MSFLVKMQLLLVEYMAGYGRDFLGTPEIAEPVKPFNGILLLSNWPVDT